MEAAVVHVDVEAEGPDTVLVRWQTTEPVAVDVSAGVRPDVVDHAHAATVPAGTTSVELPRRPGAASLYVSVAPHGAGPAMVAGARRLGFEGVQNFRDLGGYRTAGGGRTSWGRLFRADSLHKLTAADQHAFDQLGLRVVVDLRGDRERSTHPNPIAHAIQVAVTGRPVAADDHGAEERDRAEFAASLDGERVLRDLYVGMLEHSPALFHRIFSSFAARHGLPAVFHCHAGKDRTGVVAALTLLALGVSEADVLDDYVLTRRYWGPDNQHDSFANMLEMGMRPEAAAGVLGAPRWAMEDMLTELDTRYGGAEAYLVRTAGLTPVELDTLRDALVD